MTVRPRWKLPGSSTVLAVGPDPLSRAETEEGALTVKSLLLMEPTQNPQRAQRHSSSQLPFSQVTSTYRCTVRALAGWSSWAHGGQEQCYSGGASPKCKLDLPEQWPVYPALVTCAPGPVRPVKIVPAAEPRAARAPPSQLRHRLTCPSGASVPASGGSHAHPRTLS